MARNAAAGPARRWYADAGAESRRGASKGGCLRPSSSSRPRKRRRYRWRAQLAPARAGAPSRRPDQRRGRATDQPVREAMTRPKGQEALETRGQARDILARMRPAFRNHVKPHTENGEGERLGGGSILNARWNHRLSRDLNVYVRLRTTDDGRRIAVVVATPYRLGIHRRRSRASAASASPWSAARRYHAAASTRSRRTPRPSSYM